MGEKTKTDLTSLGHAGFRPPLKINMGRSLSAVPLQAQKRRTGKAQRIGFRGDAIAARAPPPSVLSRNGDVKRTSVRAAGLFSSFFYYSSSGW